LDKSLKDSFVLVIVDDEPNTKRQIIKELRHSFKQKGILIKKEPFGETLCEVLEDIYDDNKHPIILFDENLLYDGEDSAEYGTDIFYNLLERFEEGGIVVPNSDKGYRQYYEMDLLLLFYPETKWQLVRNYSSKDIVEKSYEFLSTSREGNELKLN
jgi:hypothetical protein